MWQCANTVVSAMAAAESTSMTTRHQSINTPHTHALMESRMTNHLCESRIVKRNTWIPPDNQVIRDINPRNHIATKKLDDAIAVLGLPESNPRSSLLVLAVLVKCNRLEARSNSMRSTCIRHTAVEAAKTLRNRTQNSMIPTVNSRLP